MKVVLFCGGLGTRLREYSETIPKPLVNIGSRPILWHLMQYYAQFGHREFILCLGYGGDAIRDFFLGYDARLSDDFLMDQGRITLLHRHTDVCDWKIHFINTGMHSNIGERLMAVRHLVEDEPMFLANYSDQLSDLPLNSYVDNFVASGATAAFLSVHPSQSFHLVSADGTGVVRHLTSVQDSEVWINGGFMALKPEVFDVMEPGDELVEAPFARLIEQGKLYTERYSGFWQAMDTFKDKMVYDNMDNTGSRPWELWRNSGAML